VAENHPGATRKKGKNKKPCARGARYTKNHSLFRDINLPKKRFSAFALLRNMRKKDLILLLYKPANLPGSILINT
jgi:hypothetical protein